MKYRLCTPPSARILLNSARPHCAAILLPLLFLSILNDVYANPRPPINKTISPEEPTVLWQIEQSLQPGESIEFIVNVELTGPANGKEYELAQPPVPTVPGGNTLWTMTDDSNPFTFKALNAGVEILQDTVTVSALWKEQGTPPIAGGKGIVPSPGTLPGWAYGTAYSDGIEFTWTFDLTMQFADGQSAINYTVTAANAGAAIDLTDYSVTGEAGWSLPPGARDPITQIAGTVKSSQPGKGNLKISDGAGIQSQCEDEIAFAEFDIAIAEFGTDPNLQEDRKPGGGNESPPHEMDPGGIVLVPMGVADEDPTPGKRAKLTLSGHSASGGTYTLKRTGSDKVKIYTNENATDGEIPLVLPKTWQASDLANAMTYYVGTELLSPEDAPEEIPAEATLTFTYELSLQQENGQNDAELKDEAKTTPLPVEVEKEIFMFSGHAGDVLHLTIGGSPSIADLEWKLKSGNSATGSFTNETTSDAEFKALKPADDEIELTVNGKVVWNAPIKIINIIPRSSWGAEPAKPGISGAGTTSGDALTFHHSSNTASGASEARRIQDMHMSNGIYEYYGGKNWDDIAYHKLVDKSGNVYEGRQLEAAPGTAAPGPYTKGAHTGGANGAAGIGICMMGDYESTEGNEPFSATQQKYLERSLIATCRRYSIARDKVSYHKAVQIANSVSNPSACPGTNTIAKSPEIIENVTKNLVYDK